MRWALLNRIVNPLVAAVLRSPLHGLLSRRLVLITFVGRRSGLEHTIPVAYDEDAEGNLEVRVGGAASKVWWRNLRRPSSVELRLRGEVVPATARAVERGGRVTVAVERYLGP